MGAEGRLHSMSAEERGLALEVLAEAWRLLAVSGRPTGEPIVGLVRAVAAGLPRARPGVEADYAHHVGEAAVWYLDRALRRVADPDLGGPTPGRRALNLGQFGATADAAALERLFALAAALNADDE
jgi:hypothetical protein